MKLPGLSSSAGGQQGLVDAESFRAVVSHTVSAVKDRNSVLRVRAEIRLTPAPSSFLRLLSRLALHVRLFVVRIFLILAGIVCFLFIRVLVRRCIVHLDAVVVCCALLGDLLRFGCARFIADGCESGQQVLSVRIVLLYVPKR